MIDARLGSLRQQPAARAAQAQAKPTEPEASPEPQDTVSIGTYNVRNLFDKIGQNPNNNTVAKTPAATKAAFGNIAEADADIVCLQEVENLKILNQTLKKTGLNKVYPHVVLIEGNDQRGIDVAMISKHPIKRVVSYKDREFPSGVEGKTTQFCRDLLRVDLDVKGHPFTVYTTHLKSQMGGDPSTVKRVAEAKEIRQILQEDMAPFPSRQFVVTGDFNDKASSESVKTVMGDDMVNSLEGQHAVTYPAKKLQFDYVLYPESMRDQFVSSEVRPNEEGSDHSMVVTTFRLAR